MLAEDAGLPKKVEDIVDQIDEIIEFEKALAEVNFCNVLFKELISISIYSIAHCNEETVFANNLGVNAENINLR